MFLISTRIFFVLFEHKGLNSEEQKENQLTLGYTKVFYLDKLVGKIKMIGG